MTAPGPQEQPEGVRVGAAHPPVSTHIVRALIRTGFIVTLLVWLSSCGPLVARDVDMGWWPPVTLIGAFSVHTALGVAGLAGVGLIVAGLYLRERINK